MEHVDYSAKITTVNLARLPAFVWCHATREIVPHQQPYLLDFIGRIIHHSNFATACGEISKLGKS